MNENNKWISVKERVPERGQDVLLFDKTVVNQGTRSPLDQYYWNNGKLCHPTHWQPLPEPPPKPDAFQEWWKRQNDLEGDVLEHEAKIIWDAALASVKEGKL